ncbi:hypothetical protein SAY87_010650 [Trapa incisa]|uniref:BHLH domain-containing protein n=1 Tax=Trapa incisa TaxID=236973 RepID=A0AAN7JII9_9MYRT|nr:hypothetical protein SAY87_010650 [Trapa incisa]
MMKNEVGPSKPDRKIIERNRRTLMRSLCLKLASLIPPKYCKTAKNTLTQQDQLDLAASYIKQLRERIDLLEKRKELAITKSNSLDEVYYGANRPTTTDPGVKLPVIQIKEWHSGLMVSLISSADYKNFMLCEAITILHEEGAEVVNASFFIADGKIFHILHAQVKILRVGVETSRVWQRLQELAC